MKLRCWLLLSFASALSAQVVLVSLDGITESPVGTGYNYGEVAAGDAKDVRFHARNLGSASVTVTNLKVTNITGTGFTIVNTSSTPFTIAPGNVMPIFIRLQANGLGNYTAILQVTSKDSAQQASVVQA